MPGSPMPWSPVPPPWQMPAPQPTPQGPPPDRLHPLHSPEWVAEQVRNTGRYPDQTRMTGRSTILALEALVIALKAPHAYVTVRDHHNSPRSHAALTRDVLKMAGDLHLRGVTINEANHTVRFSTPD